MNSRRHATEVKRKMNATRHRTIFDIGLHRGEDAEFYLKKGFRVIGVDANPEMCAIAKQRLASFIESGNLVVLNCAIAERAGKIEFYKNEHSEWGTANERWAERNRRVGAPPTEQITIEAVTLAGLIEEFGSPYYVKIDIEGLDLAALSSLRQASSRPKYVSIESDKVSFSALRDEFTTFEQLGYHRFKIVPQHRVPTQKEPFPAREGQYVGQTFEWGASGLFGEEAPGMWLSAADAIERYKGIFLRYQLFGDDPLIRSRFGRVLLSRLLGRPGWHDTHARLGA